MALQRAVRLDAKVSRATMSDEEINQIFEWVDVDKGGSISAAEFEAFLQEEGDEDGGLGMEPDQQLALEEGSAKGPKGKDAEARAGRAGLAAVKYMVKTPGTVIATPKYGEALGFKRPTIGKAAAAPMSMLETISSREELINSRGQGSPTSAWGDDDSPPRRGRGRSLQLKGASSISPTKGKQLTLDSTPKFLVKAQARVTVPSELGAIAAQSTQQSRTSSPMLNAPQPPLTGDPARRSRVGV